MVEDGMLCDVDDGAHALLLFAGSKNDYWTNARLRLHVKRLHVES